MDICFHAVQNSLMLWLISYITCSIVLSVGKVTGLQNQNVEAHSIKTLMLCDAPDCTQLRSSSFISCGCDLLTAHTFSWCGHRHTIPTHLYQ